MLQEITESRDFKIRYQERWRTFDHNHFPQETWFNYKFWTVEQAILLYYRIDPRHFASLGEMQDCITMRDMMRDLYGIVKSYLGTEYFRDSCRVEPFELMRFVKEKGYGIPDHFPFEMLLDLEEEASIGENEEAFLKVKNEFYPDTCASNTVRAGVPDNKESLEEDFYELALTARENAINMCIQELFEEIPEREEYLPLIKELGKFNLDELKLLKNKPQKKKYSRSHRCRAIAVFLRKLDPEITLKALYENELMKKYGFRREPCPKFRTFRGFLSKEGITEHKNP